MKDIQFLKLLNRNTLGHRGIAATGENLTISTLSLERPFLTIKLLKSIEEYMPFFKGKVLIVDNGSSKDALLILKNYIKDCLLNISLIEAKTNLGVAGGRNFSVQFIDTDWVMFLDNDIYIDKSFLPVLHNEIDILGTHFISLPLKNPDGTFFAKGGRLFITNLANNSLHIGGGNADLDLTIPEFSSFLFGGASVLNVSTFKKVGMFNQDMFIGFEDTEFSIRLWQSGYKVATSTASYFIHDHPVATDNEDINYEKKRFSTHHILRSAKAGELAHSFSFLSPHDIEWLNSKLANYSANEVIHDNSYMASTNENRNHETKVKIGIVLDVVDWAFANIIFNVMLVVQESFEFIVIPANDFTSFDGDLTRVMIPLESCKIVHFMWRAHLFNLHGIVKDFCENKGIDVGVFFQRFINDKIYSTSVYDHSLNPKNDNFVYTSFVELVKTNYYVSSNMLCQHYEQIEDLPAPRAVCPDGVDLKLFKPCNLSRFNLTNLNDRVIKVGWTGNSKWGENDHKGLHTIIKPVIEKLQLDGYLVKLEIADRNIVKREQYDMPEFYNSIDIYACASLNEGTPNTVLESMACGIIVVTTDVGIVRDALGPKQQQYIADRTVDNFYIKLKTLLDNKAQWQELSKENLEYIQSWDWPLKAQLIIDYFESLANENDLL